MSQSSNPMPLVLSFLGFGAVLCWTLANPRSPAPPEPPPVPCEYAENVASSIRLFPYGCRLEFKYLPYLALPRPDGGS